MCYGPGHDALSTRVLSGRKGGDFLTRPVDAAASASASAGDSPKCSPSGSNTSKDAAAPSISSPTCACCPTIPVVRKTEDDARRTGKREKKQCTTILYRQRSRVFFSRQGGRFFRAPARWPRAAKCERRRTAPSRPGPRPRSRRWTKRCRTTRGPSQAAAGHVCTRPPPHPGRSAASFWRGWAFSQFLNLHTVSEFGEHLSFFRKMFLGF